MQWLEAKQGSACCSVMTGTAALFSVVITATMISEANYSFYVLLSCCTAYLPYSKRKYRVMLCHWEVSCSSFLERQSILWKLIDIEQQLHLVDHLADLQRLHTATTANKHLIQ